MCEYCSGIPIRKDFPHGFRRITIFRAVDPILHVVEQYKDDQDTVDVPIKYCPFCGRKLSN